MHFSQYFSYGTHSPSPSNSILNTHTCTHIHTRARAHTYLTPFDISPLTTVAFSGSFSTGEVLGFFLISLSTVSVTNFLTKRGEWGRSASEGEEEGFSLACPFEGAGGEVGLGDICWGSADEGLLGSVGEELANASFVLRWCSPIIAVRKLLA